MSQGDLFEAVQRLDFFTDTAARYAVQLAKASGFQVIEEVGVSDGGRTHDHWSHNPALYQLSYTHH